MMVAGATMIRISEAIVFLGGLVVAGAGATADAFQAGEPPTGGRETRAAQSFRPATDWNDVKERLAARPAARHRSSPRLRFVDRADAPQGARREADAVTFPVLVANDAEMLGTLKFFGQPDAYLAVTTPGDGVIVRVGVAAKRLKLTRPLESARRLMVTRGGRPPLPRLGAPYVLTRSETSTDLSFSLFGAGYVVSVICDEPRRDPRCAGDDYAKFVAASLGLLNRPPASLPATPGKVLTPPARAPESPPPKRIPAAYSEDLSSEDLYDDNGDAFSYLPVGDLLPESGPGYVDENIYRSDIAFPVEGRAYLNSQVYRHGGYYGSVNGMDGGQCHAENYQYPWQDTFCETRSRSQDLCPDGGHEGLDIRPATCEKSAHWAVATEDARVTDVQRHWVTLQTGDGTIYNYLHLNMSALEVAEGDTVQKGDRIGLISNDYYKSDGTSVATTIHLHFEMYENYVAEEDDDPLFTKVNPYTTMTNAYEERLRAADEE